MYASQSFRKTFSKRNLKSLFDSDISNSPSVGIDRITPSSFSKKLDENISLINKKVLSGSYRFTNYRQKLLSKGANKAPRIISIPTVRDKLTLDGLFHVLSDVYETKCKSPQPQQVIQSLIKMLGKLEYDTFIKVDIQHFYGSINHKELLRLLSKRIRKKEILTLIQNAIETPTVSMGAPTTNRRKRGIPEGLSISNCLANIYLEQLDSSVQNRDDCAYYRYVDDILVLCRQENASKLIQEIISALNSLDLAVNNEKTKSGLIACDQLDYLGYVFNTTMITARDSSKQKLINSLETIIRSIALHPDEPKLLFKLNLRLTGFQTTENGVTFHRFGWLQYFSRINDIAFLGRIDHLVHKFFRRNRIAPPDSLKSIRKTYYELRYNWHRTSYIPTFFRNPTPAYCRSFLQDNLGIMGIEKLSDSEVLALFQKQLFYLAKELERDIGEHS